MVAQADKMGIFRKRSTGNPYCPSVTVSFWNDVQ